ncbi:hypothetical protein GZ78_19985 [Endozoicomonas numazuensis]|uniref:Uncharacterized protein n=1 Tax=Endozoicomonas numazuensis TaxID=1137799 RepID=A0A081NEP8_9GAMM|nr:hypothetical protein GZ78_19985 [Endozoicomonas numazuensis]
MKKLTRSTEFYARTLFSVSLLVRSDPVKPFLQGQTRTPKQSLQILVFHSVNAVPGESSDDVWVVQFTEHSGFYLHICQSLLRGYAGICCIFTGYFLLLGFSWMNMTFAA